MGYVGFSCDAFIGNKGGGVIIANTKLLCPIFVYLNSATHIVINKFKILSNNILPSILPCQKIHLT